MTDPTTRKSDGWLWGLVMWPVLFVLAFVVVWGLFDLVDETMEHFMP